MIPIDHISGFITHVKRNKVVELTANSKFIVFYGNFEDVELLIYKSGIIIYKGDIRQFNKLEKIMMSYVQDNNLTTDLEFTHIKPKLGSGWRELPRGIWLSNAQLKALEAKLEQMNGVHKIDTEGIHELARYKLENNLIIINNNQTVFTPGGFPQYFEILNSAIKSQRYDADLIIGICVSNIFGKVGPIFISYVAMTAEQAYELQIAGIKALKFLRKNYITDFFHLIVEDTSISKTDTIPVVEINNNYKNFKINNKKLFNKIYNVIMDGLKYIDEEIGIPENNLLLLDQTSYSQLDRKYKEPFTPMSLESIPIAAASILNAYNREQWINEINKQYNIDINNYQEIIQKKLVDKIIKIDLYDE